MSLSNPSHRPRPVALAVALGLALAGAATAQAQALGSDSARVIVGLKAGAEASGRAALARAGARVAVDLPAVRAVAVELPRAALAALQRHAAVAYVEDDVRRYPLSHLGGTELAPYGLALVQADQISMGTTPRRICIIDSGYDLGHEDLPGSGVTGTNDSGTGQWNTDENSHGTHVAGTIAAIAGNGKGVKGVAPGVNLHIIKVFGAIGWAYSSTLAAAALKCRDNGANIISMSLGGSVKSRTEENTFNTLSSTILSIAAAGNAGNQTNSYPASYSSVMSVAAVDRNKAWASFSQYNKQVEIAAPGVGVLSTVPTGTGLEGTVATGAGTTEAMPMDGSPHGSGSGLLFNFGLGTSTNAGAAGKVCLIQRGTNSFSDKVLNCQNSGGVAAVVYNNVAGPLLGTLNGVATTIPSVGVSDTEGAALLAQGAVAATVEIGPSDYAYFDGTSMATPHVSAVAALVWSHNAGCTAGQLRNSLNKSAQDLGAAGRDTKFGFGLVQAAAADARIKARGCGN